MRGFLSFCRPGKAACAFALFALCLLLFFLPNAASANTDETNAPPENRMGHLSIGGKFEINFTRVPNDLRLTAVLGSPYFFNNILSFKAFLSQGFFQGVLDNAANTNVSTTAGYTAFGGGVCLGIGEMLDIARPYAEIGWIGVFPSEVFTSTVFAWGLYGVIGFDILFNPGDFWGFFIEAGTAGFFSGGTAEKIAGDLTYGSGILINLGVRFYL